MSDRPPAPSHPNGQPEPSRVTLLLRAFRHPNYRLFFAGQIVSLVGTFLTQVATGWLIYHLTHSAWLLGAAGFASQIPMFALSPFAGVWVDRLNRQRLLVLTQALALLQSAGLAILAFRFGDAPGVIIPGILGLNLVQGLINAFDMPGRQAFLVEMVTDRADLANAIALNSTMVHGARLVGPAAAGMLIYWVGAGWCFTLDAISYVAVIAALLRMNVVSRPRRRAGSVMYELREGLAYTWNFAPIRALLIVMGLISLSGMPAFTTLMPIFADSFAGPAHSSQLLGFLSGAAGLGALVGAFYLAGRRSVVGLGNIIAAAGVALGAALVAFSFSRHVAISLLIVPIAGGAGMIFFASANTVIQTLVDDDKRGRVMSFFSMAFIGMTPFGSLFAGAAASRLGGRAGDPLAGAAHTVLGAGIIVILSAGAFMTRLPALRTIVRPIYVKKGILPAEVAAGMETATEMVSGAEH